MDELKWRTDDQGLSFAFCCGSMDRKLQSFTQLVQCHILKRAIELKAFLLSCWSIRQSNPSGATIIHVSRFIKTSTNRNPWHELIPEVAYFDRNPIPGGSLLRLHLRDFSVVLCKLVTSEESREHREGGWRASFEPDCHLVFVWHWCAHTKKPSASQQRRFELHTCLRSYSQLTLTQPRHPKKGKPCSHRALQKERQTDRREVSFEMKLVFHTFFPTPFFLVFPLL